MLDVRVGSRLPCEIDDAPRFRHLRQQLLVPRLHADLGPAREEDRCGRILGAQDPPEVVGEKRHHRPDHPERGDKRLPERLQRSAVAGPEAPPGPADVPVREVVDEALERVDHGGRPEPLVRLGRLGDELPCPREQPPVERMRRRLAVRYGPEALDVRIVDEEPDRVPEGEQPPLDLVRRPVAEVDVLARLSRAEEPADDVGAHAVERLVRLDRVAGGLVHLAAGLVADPLVREHRPVGEPAYERHRHEGDRVEPEADLLAALRDEVGRKPLLPVGVVGQVGAGEAGRRARPVAVRDPLGVLPAERRERDDPGVEPGVADLGDSPHLLAAALTADRHLVDPRAVQLLQLLEPANSEPLELGA